MVGGGGWVVVGWWVDTTEPQFGHNKAQKVRQSARGTRQRGGDNATRHCGHGVGGSTAKSTNLGTAQPKARQSAQCSGQRGVDHATRHCGGGIRGSERRKAGQIDVEAISHLHHPARGAEAAPIKLVAISSNKHQKRKGEKLLGGQCDQGGNTCSVWTCACRVVQNSQNGGNVASTPPRSLTPLTSKKSLFFHFFSSSQYCVDRAD